LDTGAVTAIGPLEGNSECYGSMFMYDCVPKEHDLAMKAILEPQDGYAVDPLYPKVLIENKGNHSEITDVQFEVIKCEAGPLLLEEHFDTWVPSGWTHYAWYHSYTNYAVGESPEIKYTYPPYYSNGWVMTPEINASGYEKINVKFRCYGDFRSSYYNPYFYLQYRQNATSPWRDVSPWENPISGKLGPLPFEIGCYGWGEDLGAEFQVRWYFGSYYYYLGYGGGIYLDDVIIEGCAGCAEYAELVEDAEIPWQEEVEVEFPGWTPTEWHNPDFQDTWEEYPLTTYTLLEDDDISNNKKQRLLSLYYPFLHDVGSLDFNGPETGPAMTFPVSTTIKNVGQYEECCFKVHVAIAEIDFDSAVTLNSEDFYPYYIFPPTGWTRTSTKWLGSYSNYCGMGDYAEARFRYYPSETGMFRLYTPAIDTTGYGGISIEFSHYVNHYTTPYALRVETSSDALTWTSVWDIEPSGNVGPETIKILTGDNVGADTYVSWTFDGYSWNINYWYLDGITIKGIPVSEPEWEDEVCCEEIDPGEEILYEFDDWTPAFLEEETSGVKTYNVKSWTALEDPEDNNAANDAYSRNIELTYFHDVEITEVTSPLDRSDRRFYAVNAQTNQFVWFDPETPASYNNIGSFPSSAFPQGATIANGVEYVCDTNGKIWSKDPDSADTTYIGDAGTGGLNMLAYHEKSKTMYGGSSDNLYTIDMETGSATLVGPFQQQGYFMISMDCDDDGTMYAYDLNYGSSNLYSVNLETGKATVIGNIGISAMYGQDMAYDSEEDAMWATAFNTNSWSPEYCSVNLETGKFTTITTLPGQTTCFAIPGGGGVTPDVYVTPGVQDIGALLTNLGTFSETDMTCYAEIQEFITNCTNGTTVYEDNITGIDIEEPLGGTATLAFDDYNFAMEGTYGIFLTLIDDDDDNLKNNEFIWGVGVDDTAPVSSHSLDPETPDGLEGYYIDDVTVTVSAYDPSIGCEIDGSDVKEIRYTINGVEGVIDGDFGTFDITEDGNDIEIEYWAIDNVGNTEGKHDFEIDLDKTEPVISEVEWEAAQDGGKWFITFTCDAMDETSGMDRVEMYINEGLWETVTDPGPSYVFVMEWSSAFEKVMFTFVHYDRAGWFTEDELWGGDIQSKPHSQTVEITQTQITPI
jgi:hypothetical protein